MADPALVVAEIENCSALPEPPVASQAQEAGAQQDYGGRSNLYFRKHLIRMWRYLVDRQRHEGNAQRG
jgi:hypothetical protein